MPMFIFLQASGVLGWAAAAVNALTRQCLRALATDTNHWIPDANGNVGPPNDITEQLCDNDCSGHGTCVGE